MTWEDYGSSTSESKYWSLHLYNVATKSHHQTAVWLVRGLQGAPVHCIHNRQHFFINTKANASCSWLQAANSH